MAYTLIPIISGSLLLMLFISEEIYAQENAGSSVSKSVIECYNDIKYYDRDARPPATIPVLIDLLNKVETPLVQNDRDLSKEIIHRFRQDGIIKHRSGATSPYTLPFTPKGMQSDKNKILLSQLIPGNAVNFPNNTLTPIERCTLHFLLSNSVDLNERGDEGGVCNRLSKFQRRIIRSVKDDFEIIHSKKIGQRKGNMVDNSQNPESSETDVEPLPSIETNSKSIVTVHQSDCPVENGVISTKWGPVQAGTVISGIAAGREPQTITSLNNYVTNSIFAATLSGDLAEAALWQGAKDISPIVIGDKGGWNNTLVPKWYFIERNNDWEVTDAEIRGGLDGLIIGSHMKEWHQKVPSLRISQILDMYYSPKGVFSKQYRACNRNLLFTEVAPRDKLINETIAFSFLLDDTAKLPASISEAGIVKYSQESVQSLMNYITHLHDLGCDTGNTIIKRVATDIVIVVDTAWPFPQLQGALSYLLENIDVNRYGSNFTIVSGKDFGIIVNSTKSILDFYYSYNLTQHSKYSNGFDYNKVYNNIESMMKGKLNDLKQHPEYNGRSSIVLLVPYSTSLSPSEKDSIAERREIFKCYIPDLKILVLGHGSKESYDDLADSSFDIFTLQTTDNSNIAQAVQPLIERIQQIPRRIANPHCGADFSDSSGSASFDQYVELDTTNYYRVAPHYIFKDGQKSVKFSSPGYGTLVVCKITDLSQLYKNLTENDGDCQTVTGESRFRLDDFCTDYSTVISCPHVYFTVRAQQSNIRCSESACRFPDNVKYTISIENFDCTSGSYRIVATFTPIFISVFLMFFYYL